jgi:hypothetical protein
MSTLSKKNKKNKSKTTSDNQKKTSNEKETNRKSDEISQISDQQRKYTIKNCVRYRFILFFVNLFFRLFVPVDQVNRLIDRIFNICEEIVDDHSTCLVYLKKFREHINGYYNENYENEIIQGLSQLDIFISSIEIDKKKK